MALISSPTLFSKYFGISPANLDQAGLIDPFIDVDLPLFIDPVLLEKSSNSIISKEATDAFKTHFSNFIRLLAMSEAKGDAAWRAAEKLLSLEEPPENGLGYGGSGRSGSSRPESVRDAILSTSKEIIRLGVKDPEMVSLMGFFEEDVGSDTISDFTSRSIANQLAKITAYFCVANGIPLFDNEIIETPLPRYINPNGIVRPLVLVPRDIVRDLPIANDWADIWTAASHNEKLRERVNALLAGIAKPTVADQKHALRGAALTSSSMFEDFLNSVKANASHYDPNEDALGYYRVRDIIANGFDLGAPVKYDVSKGPSEILKVVHDAIDLFKHHVENGNLWEELWVNGKPKKERASQLIFFAIADAYCSANGIDISPEANMGGGPVDFKFSSGYEARVLVEMKRSGGTVRHGYQKQLEFYLDAAMSEFGIFVVMDFGDLSDKLEQIMEIRNDRVAKGERASDIVVIDASPKASASKRH